jgi:CRP-like cAMP-binding protein
MRPVHPSWGEVVNKSQVVERLQNAPLFAGLSKKELGVVATVVKEVNAGSGDVLAKEGGPGVGFFLVLDGGARVVVKGRTRSHLGPGDTFGEIALLDHGPRTADVIAEGDTQMLGITIWEFTPLLADYPSITLKLLREVAARLRTCSGPALP